MLILVTYYKIIKNQYFLENKKSIIIRGEKKKHRKLRKWFIPKKIFIRRMVKKIWWKFWGEKSNSYIHFKQTILFFSVLNRSNHTSINKRVHRKTIQKWFNNFYPRKDDDKTNISSWSDI